MTPRVGGVQTYVHELVEMLVGYDLRPIVVDRLGGHYRGEYGSAKIIGIPRPQWDSGRVNPAGVTCEVDLAKCLHIVAESNKTPKGLGKNVIGIQHGVYWDRPSRFETKIPSAFRVPSNLARTWRWSRLAKKYAVLVCVDLVFPATASCVDSPLDWGRIRYIPNFAPEPEVPPVASNAVRRIVFSRRFEVLRGTRLFAQAVRPLLVGGWSGEVLLVGEGPDEPYLRETLGNFPQVRFLRLRFEDRLQAFGEDAVAVIPSLSTEGTSMSCIEAMSRGCLVVATCVGGLANLILPDYNGIQVRPTAKALELALRGCVAGDYQVKKMRTAAFQSYKASFSLSVWRKRWKEVLDEFRP
jgi:glycosyltransferase involved in cell wall biosynthesis